MEAVRTLEREYDYKRTLALKNFEDQVATIYKDIPRIKEIEDEIKKLGIKASKASLFPGNIELQNDKQKYLKKIDELKLEKEHLLNLKELSTEPKYECKICKDTGYVTNNFTTTMCSCMKQKLINFYYNKFNALRLNDECFEKFNYELYSNTSNIEKYKTKISPRENITKIRKISENFIENFNDESTKNLLFVGTAGSGKTFLSGCIANEIIKKGHTVIYQTAPLLLDSIFEFKYGSKSLKSKELYESLYNVDLLIIDDLGTESPSPAKFAELFAIINSRLLSPKTKTIISSNLDLENISKVYDDRLLSRFVGQYTICKFFGDDIRLK